jgi:transposase
VQRTESLRKSGAKPNGGQPGHEGHTLNASDHPDQIEIHKAATCEHCQASLVGIEASDYEERQVFDIPAIRIEVTAHRAEIKRCRACGGKSKGEFPSGVTQAVQYGATIQTWATYCTNQQHSAVERAAQIFDDLVHHPVSDATVLKASEECAMCITPSTEAVKEPWRVCEVLPVDESGLRVEGKLHGLHVASTDTLTHDEVQAKRGQEAMDDAGMLGAFGGPAVPDHWTPYFRSDGWGHALCNAHHLRALHCIAKPYQQPWADDMAEILVEIKAAVEETLPQAVSLPSEWFEAFEQRYDEIVQEGFDANPLAPPATDGEGPKSGRRKHTPPRNLLIRLRDFTGQVLAFMYDFRVPFDNNQGERDIRMVTVKQKVSGGFRTLEGAKRFGRMRGYISTARKNAKNVFEAIRDAFDGNPFIPSPATH